MSMRRTLECLPVVCAREHTDIPAHASVVACFQVQSRIAYVRDLLDLAYSYSFHRTEYHIGSMAPLSHVISAHDAVNHSVTPPERAKQQRRYLPVEACSLRHPD